MDASLVAQEAASRCQNDASADLPVLVLLLDTLLLVVDSQSPFQGAGPSATRVSAAHPALPLLLVVLLLVL